MLYNKIIIGFIIKLIRSKDLIIKKEYKIILVIINGLTKYFCIIFFKKKYLVE